MNQDTLVAVVYNGHHQKSTGSIEATAHEAMLATCVGRHSAMPLCIVAVGFEGDEFAGMRVIGRPDNPGHQAGAAWCIQMAIKEAAQRGFAYLFLLAEDIVITNDEINKTLAIIRDGWAYVGSNWGSWHSYNTQVFAARVAAYADLFSPEDFAGTGVHLEEYVHGVTLRAGLQGCIHTISYKHTHDPDHYQQYHRETPA